MLCYTDLSNVAVLDTCCLVQVFSFDPLSGQTAARYGRPATEGLELGISDPPVIVNLEPSRLDIFTF